MSNVKPPVLPKASNNMLSKSMCIPPFTPKPRVVDEDYVDVKTPSSTKGNPTPSSTARAVNPLDGRSTDGPIRLDQKSRGDGLGTPPCDPLVPPRGEEVPESGLPDPSAEEAFLLREILALRSNGGRHEGRLAESKHLYTLGNTTFTASGTEVPYALANVALGTTVTTRLTNTIALQRLRLKLVFRRNCQGASSSFQSIEMPQIHMCLFRDKTPAVPGTAITVHGTDANPPASSSLIFSRLGRAVSTEAERSIVRNPITEDLYHIYEYRRIHFDQVNAQYYQADWAYPTEMLTHEVNIDLHDAQQIYAGSAAVPITNPIYLVFWADNVNVAAYGFSNDVTVTSDLEFHDVQDD